MHADRRARGGSSYSTTVYFSIDQARTCQEEGSEIHMTTAGEKLGLELESGVIERDSGLSMPVDRYFPMLAHIKRGRGEIVDVSKMGTLDTAVCGVTGESGLDCSFSLLETAFAPVQGGAGGLSRLAKIIDQELRDNLAALASDGATLLNASEHPTCGTSRQWYARVCVPRPIYSELVDYRGWSHHVGSDAKAQNSPCTSIGVGEAISALNVMLALAPANIAIFANSPIEDGVPTGSKENRLTMWQRMFSTSRFAGDRLLHQLPDRPFIDLGDYFRWMFGPLTSSRAIPLAHDRGYKSNDVAYLQGDPALGRFLHGGKWPVRRVNGTEPPFISPRTEHFVHAQFAHFLDARFRYRLPRVPDLSSLLTAWSQPKGIESLFDAYGIDCYIEGRAPGAVLPDEQLRREAGEGVAESVVLASSALQLGLMRNLDAAQALVQRWGWSTLRALRSEAMRHAMDHADVHAFSKETLAVASAGLDPDDRHWLDYATYVIDSRRTGADRLLSLWNECGGSVEERMTVVARARSLVLPIDRQLGDTNPLRTSR